MKVIELSERTIFVDDIKEIYQETNFVPIRYKVITNNGDYRIDKEDYDKIQQYLLSLNEPIYEELPKEDNKKIEKLEIYKITDKNISGLRKSINVFNEDMLSKINAIIDKINGKDNE
jgi:tRNA A37 N6-isopentenylltransferase MiaA